VGLLFDVNAATLDELIDGLYALPLGEFISTRSAIAKTLKGAQRADDAQVVSKLTKPTAAADALNRACRARPDLVEAVLRTGGALATAQRTLLDGSGSALELREAGERRKVAIRELIASLDELLEPDVTRKNDEWSKTLEAASVDSAAGALLRRGRFVKVTIDGIGIDGSIVSDAPVPTPRVLPAPTTVEVASAPAAVVIASTDRGDDEFAERPPPQSSDAASDAAAERELQIRLAALDASLADAQQLVAASAEQKQFALEQQQSAANALRDSEAALTEAEQQASTLATLLAQAEERVRAQQTVTAQTREQLVQAEHAREQAEIAQLDAQAQFDVIAAERNEVIDRGA
jgi:hypothetical protein